MGDNRVRLRKETYRIIKEEAEKRAISMSELIEQALKCFLSVDYQQRDSGIINDFKRGLSELEDLKRDVEKIKQFLVKKFGMEVYALK